MGATSGHGAGRAGGFRLTWGCCLPVSQPEGESPTSLSLFPGFSVSSPGGSGNSPSRKFLPSQLRDKARKGALNCRDLLQESWPGGLLGGAGEEGSPEPGVSSVLPLS